MLGCLLCQEQQTARNITLLSKLYAAACAQDVQDTDVLVLLSDAGKVCFATYQVDLQR
jgi:hypothetical protein